MANAGSSRIIIKYAEDADFTENVHQSDFSTLSTTPTKKLIGERSCATGGTTLIAANQYASIQALGIENKDTTNYVTVAYTANVAATACTVLLGPGKKVLLEDVAEDAAVTITANTLACICEFFALCT